jgi:hypothetical protein
MHDGLLVILEIEVELRPEDVLDKDVKQWLQLVPIQRELWLVLFDCPWPCVQNFIQDFDGPGPI